MPDPLTKRQRSDLMRKVRSRGNTSTELRLIAIFRTLHVIGWRRHPALLGRPDFSFSQERLAVFVDGCFWHGCSQHGRLPKTNAAFWSAKIAANRARDARVTRTLRRSGWRVLRLWEHELRPKNARRLAARLRRYLPVPAPR